MAWNNDTPATANAAPEKGSVEWWKQHDALLKSHEEAKATLEAAKNSELERRTAYADFAFPASDRKEGVNTLELANGYEAKLQQPVRYSLKGSNEKITEIEERAEAIGPEAKVLAEQIITWKPGFAKKFYTELNPNDDVHMQVKSLIDEVLETKEGTPSLTIKEPKAKLNG